MKLSQLIESFVISNDEFEDYLDRATEQLAQEVQSGKNPRDAVHDLALQFANQHNKAYDAYVRMSDSLFARLHTLELDSSESTDLVPADMMNEPMSDMSAMNEPEMGVGDAMGGMDMDVPAEDEMPSDSDMEDYAAVMDNEPEAEEMEESCGSSHKKKIREAEGEGTYARVSYEYSEDWGSIDLYKNHNKVAEWDGYFGANETGNPLARKFVEMCKEHGFNPMKLQLVDENGDIGTFNGKTFKWEDSVSEEDTTMGSIEVKTDEERAGRAALFNLRKIVDEKQARSIKFVDGSTKVDMFTASAIVKVYDAVNAANKAKIINMLGTGKAGLLKVANAAMKLVSTNESLQENPLAAIAPVAGAVVRGAAAVGGAVARGAATAARGAAKAAANPIVRGAVKGAVKGGISAIDSGSKYVAKNAKAESVDTKANKIMESAISKSAKSKK